MRTAPTATLALSLLATGPLWAAPPTDSELPLETIPADGLTPPAIELFSEIPGVRQFRPWEIVPAEVASAFRDLRPVANLCRFPDCTHTHESGCAVKHAVADGLLDTRRWESCCQLAGADDGRPEEDE